LQIADFGMARDMTDEDYYVASGGKIPVKWTAPEVAYVSKDLSIVPYPIATIEPLP